VEFFAVSSAQLRAEELQRHVRIDNLPQWCASIEKVLDHEGERGNVYSVWGEFRIRREVIHEGVRFTLPGCINALQWTLTAGAEGVTIHATINRKQHDPDFIESLEQFVADWQHGLDAGLARIRKGPDRNIPDCGLWIA